MKLYPFDSQQSKLLLRTYLRLQLLELLIPGEKVVKMDIITCAKMFLASLTVFHIADSQIQVS